MPQTAHTSPFDRIRQLDDQGFEYWSARDLSEALEYTEWRNFSKVISQARIACQASNQELADHFVDVNKMIPVGKGGRRAVPDVRLSRYACYLVAQNADPSKDVVAQAQTYFAIQTRRAELADAERIEDVERALRISTREQIRAGNKRLAATAYKAGVKSGDFAQFQNAGYRGLYGGLTAVGIADRKGLKKHQPILDYMGVAESAANLFRITQTDQKLCRDKTRGTAMASETHHRVGAVIRQAMAALGATMPEDLPTPTESIETLRSKQKRVAQTVALAKLPAPKRRSRSQQ